MWPFLDRAVDELWRKRWQRWLVRRHPRGIRTQVLGRDRVYIFLSRTGALFCAVLLAMLGGAVNYDLALAYVMVFLLMSMALVSIFHTFRNLLGLHLTAGRTEGCFAGERARFEILVDNPGSQPRQSLELTYHDTRAVCDVPNSDGTRVWLTLPAPKRGWLVVPRLRIDTHWPIGVFHAWSYANFEQRALIYPAPEADPPPLPVAAAAAGEGVPVPRGQDDFAGLRPFSRGDSPRRIAWKAAARGDVLPVKEFHGQAASSLWLEWDRLPPDMHTEARLSRLAAWVLAAFERGQTFGLSLPGRDIVPDHDEAHRDACLAALALYGERSDSTLEQNHAS
ncbi:MAG: DUF58 domain-containing protein [Burkholderiales bacterium]|nr:DUF58 domain-containing protein [Burkholderiales bacterium]